MQAPVDVLLRNRVHLLVVAAVMSWAWQPWHGTTFGWVVLLPVWLTGFGVYQFNRLFDDVEDAVNAPAEHSEMVSNRRMIWIASVSALVASVGLASVSGSLLAFAIIVAASLLGVAYSRPTVSQDGQAIRLKQLLVVKNLIPSLVWPTTAIVYPVAVSGSDLTSASLAASFLVTATGVFIIEVAWDIRDMTGDRVAMVLSVPVRYGADVAGKLCFAVGAAAAVIITIATQVGLLANAWMFPAACLSAHGLLAASMRRQLAGDRRWSHALVAPSGVALLIVGVLGRVAWGL